MTDCPFCQADPARVFFDVDETILCLWDGYPVAPGHALVVPRRHVGSWFEATRTEQSRLLEGIEIAKREIVARYAPDGFNIGVNVGEAAGQTVDHLHVHVIPRYQGDVPDPRGGVRHVIPGKGNYLAMGVREEARAYRTLAPVPAIVGESDTPLLRYLREDLAGAERVDLAVAFVLESGLELMRPYLEDVLDRGGRVRVLTGDYLGVTEPRALLGLLDLEGDVVRRVFVTDAAHGFHPKAYLVRRDPTHAVAYVGSSNLTRSALERGVEWNHRLDGARDPMDLERIGLAFEALLHHPRTVSLTADWIEAYRRRRPGPDERVGEVDPTADAASPPPQPHAVQMAALEALEATRAAGNRAGLVVLATGLGKTWLSAFDSQGFSRVLFVAHREEILRQARDTFRRIRPDAGLGLYTGTERSPEADVLFASVQTLGRARHLEHFARDAFDYVVVDEFHHACAATYRRLIDHFEPEFLLGLTATPERTDGGDLLGLCEENLVFRCDLGEGIGQGLLTPFHYFGVPDEVEYDNIPWRSGRFDPEALHAAVATQARAANAFEQWRKRGGRRTLAFCASVRHAEFMRDFFADRGVAAAAVHSEPSSAPRALTLERLEAGELEVVFAVDLFNEGVDLPHVDTVLMLRPTESRILWLQQFGRGLRLAEGKDHLTVIDYVGNHRTFLQVPMLLLPGVDDHAGAVAMALEAYRHGELELPPGCKVTYDVEALEILERLSRSTGGGNLLRAWYEAFRDRNGVRPTAVETWHAGHDPKSMRRSHRSWLGFVATMGDLGEREREAEQAARAFLRALETTPMTKSFKMVVLLAMIGEEAFPGSIPLDRLAQAVRRRARRATALANDFGDALDDDGALQQLLVDNPIDAWAGGKGTGGTAYFAFDGTTFSSDVPCVRSMRTPRCVC